jgi:magnesium-dependent phosphatase 1
MMMRVHRKTTILAFTKLCSLGAGFKFGSLRFARSSTSALKMTTGAYPELIVYDMDACLWDKEMYEMTSIPTESDVVRGDLNGRGEGVIGVMSGRDKISLHKGSLISLQEHADVKYPGMKVAFASSADTPFAEKVGRASLKLLDVLPGLTVWDLVVGRDWNGVDVNQIGRQPPLSSNKARSHFPRLKEATGIRYDRMLFFDDCNWGDHCGMVAAACREPDTGMGPATMRTPYGLGEREWLLGLDAYAAQAKKLAEQATN